MIRPLGPGRPKQPGPRVELHAPIRRRHEVADVAAMHAVGRRLARLLRPGDLIILRGPLGAGKTTFAQGVGDGLGVRERLTSPTFVLARVHQGERLPIVHVDGYRLGGVDELDTLDLEAELDEAVTLVEWGEGLAEQLAEEHLLIDIQRDSADGSDDDPLAAPETRIVTLWPHGAGWTARVLPEREERT